MTTAAPHRLRPETTLRRGDRTVVLVALPDGIVAVLRPSLGTHHLGDARVGMATGIAAFAVGRSLAPRPPGWLPTRDRRSGRRRRSPQALHDRNRRVFLPTHLLVAGLLGRRLRTPVGWAVAGAALPDLVDKPLASLGVVDLFHSVGHSALLAVVVVPVALLQRAGLAAAAGWASHLVLDAFHVVLNGRAGDALFLVWPVAVPPDPLAIPPGEFLRYYLWSPSFFIEVAIWAGAVALAVRAWRGRAGTA